MKQVFSNFLLPIIVIVSFLAKNGEGSNGRTTPPPDTSFDRVRMPDSAGTAMYVNENQQLHRTRF
jgi:hypothetical protein